MAIYKHVSSKEIVRKVFRDIKPATADFVHDAIEWIGEALEHIGASAQLCTKHVVIPIANHKGNLPGDLYYINQVAINTCVSSTVGLQINTILDQIQDLNSNILDYSEQLSSFASCSSSSSSSSYSKGTAAATDSASAAKYAESTTASAPDATADTTTARYDFAVARNSSNAASATTTTTSSSINDFRVVSNNQLRDLNVNLQMLTGMYFNQGSCLQPLQYGASTFHKGSHCDQCVNEITKYKETYIINCGLIQTSFETGYVCLSYTAFPTDDECFPMVPDDISFREAMFWYIYKKLLLQGIPGRNQKIGYDYAELMWQNYCTQARNAANYPDIDRYESFLNQWVRLVPDINSHQYFFETMNDREQFTEDNF